MTLHLLGLIFISLVFLNGCAKSGFSPQSTAQTTNNVPAELKDLSFDDQSNNAQTELVVSEEEIETPNSKEDETPVAHEPKQKPPTPSVTKEENKKSEAPKLEAGQVLESGFIKPTIYYHAVIDEDKNKCSKSETLTSPSGSVLANICEKTLTDCKMEGSCAIVQNGVQRSFNISSKINGIYRFFETTKDVCKFGYGVKQTCLDPFYSVAADLSIYHTGDVLFIPAIRGVQLPDGSKHSGYFVVRDTGNKIMGKGRFDFYSGFLHWNDKKNPFMKLGLADIKTQIPYKIIGGVLAVSARASRAFPKIP